MQNIFYKISGFNKDYIFPVELGNYLKSKDKIITISESDLLFIRLDRNRDGKVTKNDFLFEFSSILL